MEHLPFSRKNYKTYKKLILHIIPLRKSELPFKITDPNIKYIFKKKIKIIFVLKSGTAKQ